MSLVARSFETLNLPPVVTCVGKEIVVAIKKKLPGKRKIKKTKFGKRALSGAKKLTDRIKNPSGSHSSVRTATFDIPGKKTRKGQRTDVMLAPTIRKDPITGIIKQLSNPEAAKAARKTGDFVRVVGGITDKAIQKARAKGDKKSRKFSKRLGKISDKARKRKSK